MHASTAPAHRPSNPWPWIALSVAIVAVAAVVLVPQLAGHRSDRSQDTGYRDLIARVIDPVGSANDALSDDLSALESGDSPGSAIGSAWAATLRARRAREALARLELPSQAGGPPLGTGRAPGAGLGHPLGG